MIGCMEKSNKALIIVLVIILIAIICGIGIYYIFNLNSKIEEQNATICDLKNENLNNQAVIEEITKESIKKIHFKIQIITL